MMAKLVSTSSDVDVRLDRENRVLKNTAQSWQQEREQLIQKTEIARSKVEAMIIRLKALEQET